MVYFDNSATTPLCESSLSEMKAAVDEFWGNPSSLHEKGLEAELYLEKARKMSSDCLCCAPDEIIFTSGGTQGNNIAILGSAFAGEKKGKTLITTKIEHPSVLRSFEFLENRGFNVKYISVDSFGRVDLNELENALNDDVVFVSVMFVNNELGTIQPVGEISRLIRKRAKKALFHSDMVQAFGKMRTDVNRLGVDIATLSGHKIHAPKGAGVLFVKKGTKLLSPSLGGGQEKGIRSGTQPMPSIAGLYGAMKEINITESAEKVKKINSFLRDAVSGIEGAFINSPSDALPYVLNVSFPGYPSEVLLNYLSERKIYVSSGSACAKGKKSEILTAADLSSERINSSIRLSFSRYNTIDEARAFVEAINAAMKDIKKSR